jgi:hypothetical protein
MKNKEFNLKWLHSAEDIPQDAWEACFPKNVEGYWWYKTLEQSSLEAQFQFIYGAIYQNSRLVGIVPCFIMDFPLAILIPESALPLLQLVSKLFPSLLHQRTLFIGSPCSDEGTLGVTAEIELERLIPIIQTACEKLMKKLNISILAWKDFTHAYSPYLEQLITDYNMFKFPSFPGVTLDISKMDSFESYLKIFDTKKRNNLRRKIKIGRNTIDLVTTIEKNPDAQLLDEMFHLFWATYNKAKIKFERLNKSFFRNIAQQSVSFFICIREKKTNKVVAVMLCFDLGDRIINKFIGLDYKQPPKAYLYFRLWEEVVIKAIDMHATELQSGQAGYATKILLGNSLIDMTNYCKHRNKFVNFILKLIAPKITWGILDSDLKNHKPR